MQLELASRWEDASERSPRAGALGTRLVHVHFAMLHHLGLGFEFRTASGALVFLPE
jgi:hypothetical protein